MTIGKEEIVNVENVIGEGGKRNETKKPKTDKNQSEEDKFCIVVLARAKEIFGDDAKKIDVDRMIQLCCLVADDVNYPLTRGWYKCQNQTE